MPFPENVFSLVKFITISLVYIEKKLDFFVEIIQADLLK